MTQGVNAKRRDHLEHLKANVSHPKCLRVVDRIKVQCSLHCYVQSLKSWALLRLDEAKG